ncbi:MAG: pyrroline-5-carboxylate reductase [Pirellulaceae bacterium]
MKASFPATKIGFVGGGRMAQALARGLGGRDWIDSISFVDPDDEAARKFSEQCSAAKRCNNEELAGESQIIVLAVKPQVMRDVLADISAFTGGGHLIVSVAAGVPIAVYRAALNSSRIVRVMPNTPCLIGQGMSAMCCDAGVTDQDQQTVAAMLESVGEVAIVDESQIDAVTGVSGSGPAYVYTFIEALTAGGVEQGLPHDLAHQLATQTVLGAAQLVKASGQPPAELRDQVTSPGGTTIEGLHALSESGFGPAVRNAVAAATRRSVELSTG